jgi:hypothetical protein
MADYSAKRLPEIQDMELDEKTIAETTQYRKSFGQKWVNAALYVARCRAWVATHLKKKEGKVTSPFNSYREATDVYTRKDGKPVTMTDIQAVLHISPGQGSKTDNNPGDMEIVHNWFVDSSD